MNFKKTYSNYLILINIIIFIIIFIIDPDISSKTLIKFGAKSNFKIVDFEIFRLLTSMFLHVTLYHIFFNSFALYIIGNQVESMLGKKKFLILYFTSGIIGAMGSFILNNFVAAGASAGIFGLLGTHIYLFLYNRNGYKKYFGNDFLILIGINVAYGFFNSNIDNSAHMFGLLTGFLVVLFMEKQIPKIKFNQKFITVAIFSLILISFSIKFINYKYSEDYYFAKSIYLITDEQYDTAYYLLEEAIEKFPTNIDFQNLIDLFIIK